MPYLSVVKATSRELFLGFFIIAIPLYVSIFITPDWRWLLFSIFYAIIFIRSVKSGSRYFRTAVLLLSMLPFFCVSVLLLVSYTLQRVGFNEAFYYHFNRLGIHGHESKVLLLSVAVVLFYLLFCFLTFTLHGKKTSGRSTFYSGMVVVLLCFVSPQSFSFARMYCNAHDYRFFFLYQQSTDALTNQEMTSLLQDADTDFTYQVEEKKKKNLIFIYAESLEANFFDQEVFPGQLNGLDEIQKSSIVFTNMYQTSYTGWTIAGMVASLCGLPLQMPLDSSSNNFNLYDDFMADSQCITDLLKEEEYSVSFIGGADLDFAGKKAFLQTHGFDPIMGRKRLMNKYPENERDYNQWGLRDRPLFHEAFNNFLESSSREGPFAQFLLTLDTHAPGFPDPVCSGGYQQIKNNIMLDAVHCSSRLINDFIGKVRSSRYSEQTVIVVMSDHLAHANPADKMLKQKKRKLMFMINLPSGKHFAVDNPGTHYDIGPTVLQTIGLVNDHPYGLGHNMLVSPDDAGQSDTRDGLLPERFGLDNLYSIVNQPQVKAFVRSKWDGWLGKIDENGILVNDSEYTVKVGNKHYSFRDPHPFKGARSGALVFVLDRNDYQMKDVVSLKDFLELPDRFSVEHWLAGTDEVYVYVGNKNFLPFLEMETDITENVVAIIDFTRRTGAIVNIEDRLSLSLQEIIAYAESEDVVFKSSAGQSYSLSSAEEFYGISLLSCLNQSCKTHVEDALHNVYKGNWGQGLSVCRISDTGTVEFLTHIDSNPAAYENAPSLNALVQSAKQENKAAVVLIGHDSICLDRNQTLILSQWGKPFALEKLEDIQCNQPYIGIIHLGNNTREEFIGEDYVQVTL